MLQRVSVDTLTLDRRLQHRADAKGQPGCVNQETAADYAAGIEAGTFSPDPVCVIQEGRVRWIWSGFHTLAAQVAAGKKQVQAEVEEGTFADALSRSTSAATRNTSHGKPYSAADRRNVLTALFAHDPAWYTRSAKEIAAHTGIPERACARIRADLPAPSPTGGHPRTPADFKTVSENTEGGPLPPPEPEPRKRGRPPGPSRKGVNGRATGKGAGVPVDADGRPIPENLRDAFGEPMLREMADSLAGYRRALSGAASWAVHLPLSVALNALEVAEQAVRDGIPHAVCPHCEGAGGGPGDECPLCSGAGYLNEPTYTNLEAPTRA